MNKNSDKELLNDESNNLESLTERLKELKDKEKYVEELNDFSKRLYFSSIPVMLIFTVFLEAILNTPEFRFNLYEYLMMNSIAMPSIFLINNFICGTSISRKKEISNINNDIINTENLINILSKENQEKNIVKVNDLNNSSRIKPIDRTFDVNNSKTYTKTLTK